MSQKKTEDEAFRKRKAENNDAPPPIQVEKEGDQIGSYEREEQQENRSSLLVGMLEYLRLHL